LNSGITQMILERFAKK